MKDLEYYLQNSYIGLAISLLALILLMIPKYEFNFSYFQNASCDYVLTFSDIYDNANLREFGAKQGDCVKKAVNVGTHTPAELRSPKLIRVSEYYNLKYISSAFIGIFLAYFLVIGKINLLKIIAGFSVHFFMLSIPILIYQDIYISLLYSFAYYPLVLLYGMTLIYFFGYIMIPYFQESYANSLLGLYIKTKKHKLRKQLEKEIDEDK